MLFDTSAILRIGSSMDYFLALRRRFSSREERAPQRFEQKLRKLYLLLLFDARHSIFIYFRRVFYFFAKADPSVLFDLFIYLLFEVGPPDRDASNDSFLRRALLRVEKLVTCSSKAQRALLSFGALLREQNI